MPRQPTREEFLPVRRQAFAVRKMESGPALPRVSEVVPPLVKQYWQSDAYTFASIVGEVGYLLDCEAGLLRECRMRAEVRNARGEWEETHDPRAVAILADLTPPSGNQGDLLATGSIHHEIAGEMAMYGETKRDQRGREIGTSWNFLSTSELKIERKGEVEIASWGAGVGKHKAPPDGFVKRFLSHPSPEYSERATSAVFRVLPQMRSLVLLDQLIDACAKSQLSAGGFYLPDEVSFGTPDEFDDPGNPGTGVDPLEEEFHDFARRAVVSNDAPERLGPLVLRGPAALVIGDKLVKTLEAMGSFQIGRQFDTVWAELRKELLGRIARGLNTQPEIIEGKGSLNHWTGFNVDDQFIATNIGPVGRLIVHFLTVAYFRPMMVLRAGLGEKQAQWFRIGLDLSPVTTDADRSLIATTGYELGEVAGEAWRRHAGLSEEDAPDEDERFERMLHDLAKQFPDVVPAVLPVLFPEHAGVREVIAAWPAEIRRTGGTSDGGEVDRPVDRGNQGPPEQEASLRFAAVRALAALSDRALSDALDTAALRLIARASTKEPETAKKLRTIRRADVLTRGGRKLAQACGLEASHLFADCFDGLGARTREWLADDMVRRGIDRDTARHKATVTAGELVEQLTLLGASALDRPLVLQPNGTRVPDDLIASAFAAGDLVGA